MSCPELLRTQAFIDGELDSAASRDAERHIESCAECRDFVAAAAAASDLLLHAQRHAAPAGLRAKVLADLRSQEAPAPFTAPSRRRGFWLGAGSGAGAVGLAAMLAFFLLLPPSATTLEGSLVDAHTNALMAGRTIQVASSNHHTVKPWFAGRIAISPPVADYSKEGFDLIGGRIENVHGIDMAVVVYRHGAHLIDLYAWADQGTNLSPASSRHGYGVRMWKQQDLDLAAVSDIDAAELDKFVQLVGRPAE